MRPPRWLYTIPLRCRSLIRWWQAEQELDEELRYHFDQQVEDYIARGATPAEARARARRTLGNITAIKEETRDMWKLNFITQAARDVRYALRAFGRSPGFTFTAVACLALGIAACTAMYSVAGAVLLKPLPFRDSNRMVRVYTEFTNWPGGALKNFDVSVPEFLELQRDGRVWDRIEAWTSSTANLGSASEPVRIIAPYVTGGLMEMIGTAPQLGRPIAPADAAEGANPVLVLSHELWRQAFASDRSVIGRNVRFNDSTATVVGVMPPGFEFPPGRSEPAQAWAPLGFTAEDRARRSDHNLSVIARLRPGLGIQAARAELAGLLEQSGARASGRFHVLDLKNHPVALRDLREDVAGNTRPAMMMLLGAVALFLLIACVNVANLLLARSSARRREIAMRLALGASTGRLLGQFTVEGVLLSLAGAAAGIPLASLAVKLIAATNAGTIPRIREAGIDASALAFCLAVTAFTGFVFGLAPMLHSGVRSLGASLQAATSRTIGSRGANRVKAALAAAELSLALTLLIGAGLLARSLWNLQQVKLGFDPRGLVTMRVSVKGGVYANEARLRRLWQDLGERLAALPGAQAATVVDSLPPQRFATHNDTKIEGFVQRPGGPIENVDYNQSVGHRFFETFGIRLIAGRFFDARDGANTTPVVIVNEAMARTFWPGENPLGRRIFPPRGPWRTVVGVVGDVRNAGLDRPAGTEVFFPAAQAGNVSARTYAVVKTAGNPELMLGAARQAIREIDPSLPVALARTMDGVLGEAVSRPRFLALMLTLFSALALVLAAFGIYGVVSYSVAQRTPEFGIRMALGARPADVFALVLRQGVMLTVVGLAIGSAGAALFGRWLQTMLFGVSQFDPGTFAAMALILGTVTLLACWVPARRATAADPVQALRNE